MLAVNEALDKLERVQSDIAKLVNNMIVGVEFAIVAEGFALAERNGVDVSTLYEAIKSGWAGSKVLDVAAPAMAKGEYIPGGTVNMIRKDLGYARDLAADSHVPVPMTALAHEIYVAGQAAGTGARSQPVLIELWRRLFFSGDGARATGT